MDKKEFERLKNLCTAFGVSSDEREVRQIIKNQFDELGYEIISDRLGSIFANKKSKNKNAKTLMIACAMDEVGLMIQNINEDGSLQFVQLEPLSPASLLHQTVTIKTIDDKKLTGVIVCKSMKFLEEKNSTINEEQLVIDCGLSFDEISKKVRPGDLVSFKNTFEMLNEHILMTKAANSRVCVEVLLEVIERLKNEELDYNVVIGSIAQSIVGYRGTKTATYVVQPDAALVLTGFETNKSNPKVLKGQGVLLGLYDKQMIPSQRLRAHFQEHCQSSPYIGYNGNDGSFIHKTLKGTPTLSVGIAMTEMGSGHELVDLRDIEKLVDQLVEYVKGLTTSTIEHMNFGVNYD